MQDRSYRNRGNLLHRTAGPYIRVNFDDSDLTAAVLLILQSGATADMVALTLVPRADIPELNPADSTAKKRLSKQRGNEIIQEQEQLGASTNPAPPSVLRGLIASAAICQVSATYDSPGFIVALVFSPRGESNENSIRGTS
jgi:hypothetical protein